MPKTGELKKNYIVSSLVRGLKILSAFTVNRPSLRVSDIAELTGLDQATVFRFAYTLELLGYLVRDEESKHYRQGVRMLSLCLPAREGMIVNEIATPIMYELSRKVNETVKLAVLDGVEVVIIGLAEIPDRLIYRTPIGHRSPTYCTAQGKVLLAYQPVEDWDRLITMIDFTPRTENTILDPKVFRHELLQVLQQGYAVQDGELLLGLGAIAVPVFDHRGAVAALNISGLSMQILKPELLKFYVTELRKSAQAISAQLGHVPGTSKEPPE